MTEYEDNDAGNIDQFRKKKWNAQKLLPRALIEAAIGAEGISALAEQTSLCLVVEVPTHDWVDPVLRYLKEACDWSYSVIGQNKRRPEEDSVLEQITKSLANGGKVLGVSEQPVFLPASLLATADQILRLPHPTGEVVSNVIEAITGEKIDIPQAAVSTLGFLELAGSLRQGTTAAECLSRLNNATESKKRASAVVGAPHIRDLHGYGAAKSWALELIEDLESVRRGEILLQTVERNVVLASEPGLGKSSFIKSLAFSAGLPLISTSCANWFANGPGYLDSVIKQISKTFELAKATAPCVLFIDELDAVPNRATLSGRGSDWWTPVITHLLLLLDSTVSELSSDLIVVGATNHADRLDAALVRPGRLSRVIEIGLPDHHDLIGILRQHLVTDLSGEDLSLPAMLLNGSSGAKAKAVVTAARRIARKAGRSIAVADLIAAIAPDDDRKPELRRRIAIHEAGHAVVGECLFPGSLQSVSLLADEDHDGITHFGKIETITKADMENLVTRTLSGRAAEAVLLGDPSLGAGGTTGSDLARATHLLGSLHLSAGMGETLLYRSDLDSVAVNLARHPRIADAVEADLQRLYKRAQSIVAKNRAAIERVVHELVANRFVGRERFLELVAEKTDG